MKVLVEIKGDSHCGDKTLEVEESYALEMLKSNPYCKIVLGGTTKELEEENI